MPVEPSTFPIVMSAHQVAADLIVADHLAGSGTTSVWLQFRDLYDLLPEGIAVQMPALEAACKRRDALLRLRAVSGRQIVESAIRNEDMRARLTHELGPPPPDLIGHLLGEHSRLPRWIEYKQLDAAFDVLREQLDLHDRDALHALVTLLWSLLACDPGDERDTPIHILRIIKEIDRRINSQLNALLHAPEVLRVETVWRGLKALVDAVDAGNTVSVDLLDASKAVLLEDLRACGPVEDAALLAILLARAAPYDLVVTTHAFDPHGEDLEVLAGMAAVAKRALVPLLADANLTVLGLASLAAIPPELPALHPDWASFRAHPAARFVGLCVPRFLLRAPYGEHDDDFRTLFIRFRETSEHDRDPRLWGPAAIALATRIATAFTDDPAATSLLTTLEARLTPDHARTLATAGAIGLVARPDGSFLPDHWMMAQGGAALLDLLLLTRLARHLAQVHYTFLAEQGDPDDAEQALNDCLRRATESPDLPFTSATITLRPTLAHEPMPAFRLTVVRETADGQRRELGLDGRFPPPRTTPARRTSR